MARDDELEVVTAGSGLTSAQAAACEVLIRIPMGGHGTSLNLAVAAGVMLFEMQKAFGG